MVALNFRGSLASASRLDFSPFRLSDLSGAEDQAGTGKDRRGFGCL